MQAPDDTAEWKRVQCMACAPEQPSAYGKRMVEGMVEETVETRTQVGAWGMVPRYG